MQDSRLTIALDQAPLPDGRIAVFGPHACDDLSAFPKDRAQLIQGFAPDRDALMAQGYSVAPAPDGEFAGAVIILPRAKAEARAMVAEASALVAKGGPIWIDGQKTNGIDSMLRDLRKLGAEVSEPFAKAHGKVFRLTAAGVGLLADWQACDRIPTPGFITRPGVFSADGIDRGSQVLAQALPEKLPTRIADLGAGWGWLSAQILAHTSVESLDLIEADHQAVTCAKRNVTDPRARFFWADVTTFRPERRYRAVITNPPFHQGRDADPALGAAFIRAGAALLVPDGQMWLVANRHLPYERTLNECFRNVTELGQDGGFKVFHATRPMTGVTAASKTGAPTPQFG